VCVCVCVCMYVLGLNPARTESTNALKLQLS